MNNITKLKDINFKQPRNYIGASDIPTLAGLNKKYGQTSYTLWQQKMGIAESFQGNERTKAGKEFETSVLKFGLEKLNYDFNPVKLHVSRLKNKYKYKKLCSLTEAAYPKHPYIKAHADLIEVAQPFGMEAKATGFFGGKRNDDINLGYDPDDLTANGIPSSVYLQIQAQMLCYGIDMWYVSVTIDTGDHRLYGPIYSHKKTQEKILALCIRFWWHVENNKEPKPETWDDVTKLFPKLKKDSQTMISGPELDKAIEMKEQKKNINKKIKKLEEKKEDIKNAMGLLIEGNQYLVSATGDKLAKASESTRYFLKDHKEMDSVLKKKLIEDGFISVTTSRGLRF